MLGLGLLLGVVGLFLLVFISTGLGVIALVVGALCVVLGYGAKRRQAAQEQAVLEEYRYQKLLEATRKAKP
jgi:multisubunit Na+/H+ antiporter MnhB subunit